MTFDTCGLNGKEQESWYLHGTGLGWYMGEYIFIFEWNLLRFPFKCCPNVNALLFLCNHVLHSERLSEVIKCFEMTVCIMLTAKTVCIYRYKPSSEFLIMQIW